MYDIMNTKVSSFVCCATLRLKEHTNNYEIVNTRVIISRIEKRKVHFVAVPFTIMYYIKSIKAATNINFISVKKC